MRYEGGALSSLIDSYCFNFAVLTVGGGLTPAVQSNNKLIGEAIASVHNSWQDTVIINNVLVNGGICAPQGPLSGGIGLMAPGTIAVKINSPINIINSNMIITDFDDYTEATQEFMDAVSIGFKTVYDLFISTMMSSAIAVSGGTCTCKIVAAVPIPGTYQQGEGKLDSLDGNILGTVPSKNSYYNAIVNDLGGAIVADGSLTEALDAHIESIALALADIHTTWMSSTKLNNLQVNGGFTFPGAPIVGAIGSNGQLI